MNGRVLSFFKAHFFSVIIVLLLLLLASSSYVRFIVQNDYLVSFEGECDPYSESCYEGCEDEECTEVYYYSIIERHASELSNLCGSDISDCDDAFVCQPAVENCSVTYCDETIDGEDVCVVLSETEI